jgi:hypothetical protein
LSLFSSLYSAPARRSSIRGISFFSIETMTLVRQVELKPSPITTAMKTSVYHCTTFRALRVAIAVVIFL